VDHRASLVVIGLYNTQVTIKGASEFEGIHILRLLFNLGYAPSECP
jgi:hypothetical protein